MLSAACVKVISHVEGEGGSKSQVERE